MTSATNLTVGSNPFATEQLVQASVNQSGEKELTPSQEGVAGTIAIVSAEGDSVAAVVSVPILGSVLDELTKRVDASIKEAINSAKNAGLELEIEAGRQISIAIEDAKNAYQESMQKTMDKVDSVVQKQVEQLKSMVQDLEAKTQESLERFEERVQEYLNTLPMANKRTQLRRVQPHYAVIQDHAESVNFRFEGNFVYSASKGFEPTLSFPHRDGSEMLTFQPIDITTQSLTFAVPVNTILAGASKDPLDHCSYALGTLSAPWDNGWWWWSSRVEANYKVYLGALPLAPGKIFVEYSTSKEEIVRKPFRSVDFKAWGDDFYKKQKWVEKKFVILPSEGYHIASQPVINYVDKQNGNHTERFTRIERELIEVTVGLDCTDGKHMGRVQFYVTFDEQKTKVTRDIRQEEVALKWGDSTVVKPAEGEKLEKVIFKSFDGQSHEFAGPNLDHPFLKIHAEGGGWRLEATIPKDVTPKMMLKF